MLVMTTTADTVTKSIASISKLLEQSKNGPINSPLYMRGYQQGLEHALDIIKCIAELETDRIQFEAKIEAICNRRAEGSR